MCFTIQARIPTIEGSQSALSLKQRAARGGGRRSDGVRGRERTDLKRQHASSSEMAHRVPLLTAQNVMSKNRNAPGIAHAIPLLPAPFVGTLPSMFGRVSLSGRVSQNGVSQSVGPRSHVLR